MKTYKLILSILGALMLITNGCIWCEKLEVHYKISSNLSGESAVIFWGVSSDKKEPKMRMKEMKEFYDGGYLKEVEALKAGNDWFGKMFSIMDSLEIELFDKTDTTCNAKAHGKIRWFPSSLTAFVPEEYDTGFMLQKVDDYLYVTIGVEDVSDSDTSSTFTLEYEGNIVTHNANTYDEASNRLQWKWGKIQPPGIYFVLDIDL
jgi:hypothetical protein